MFPRLVKRAKIFKKSYYFRNIFSSTQQMLFMLISSTKIVSILVIKILASNTQSCKSTVLKYVSKLTIPNKTLLMNLPDSLRLPEFYGDKGVIRRYKPYIWLQTDVFCSEGY